MPRLRTLLGLSPRERWLTFEAMVLLAWARALVRFVPPRRWPRRFGGSPPAHFAEPLGDEDRETITLVARAVSRAVRNAPVQLVCLPQALAARAMLRRRGIAVELKIGALRKGAEGDRFHAWTKAGGRFVTGACDETEYAVFASAPPASS